MKSYKAHILKRKDGSYILHTVSKTAKGCRASYIGSWNLAKYRGLRCQEITIKDVKKKKKLKVERRKKKQFTRRK